MQYLARDVIEALRIVLPSTILAFSLFFTLNSTSMLTARASPWQLIAAVAAIALGLGLGVVALCACLGESRPGANRPALPGYLCRVIDMPGNAGVQRNRNADRSCE